MDTQVQYRNTAIATVSETIQNALRFKEENPKSRLMPLSNRHSAFYGEYATKGKYWGQSKVKLMLVGIAVGLIDENKVADKFFQYVPHSGKESPEEYATRLFDTDPQCGLSWTMDKDPDKKGSVPICNKPFFSLGRKVLFALDDTLDNPDSWPEYLLRSNLYKLVYKNGGNPIKSLMEIQKETMPSLLKAEIEYYEPTHILVVSGGYYRHPFEDMLHKISGGIKVGYGGTSRISK